MAVRFFLVVGKEGRERKCLNVDGGVISGDSGLIIGALSRRQKREGEGEGDEAEGVGVAAGEGLRIVKERRSRCTGLSYLRTRLWISKPWSSWPTLDALFFKEKGAPPGGRYWN